MHTLTLKLEKDYNSVTIVTLVKKQALVILLNFIKIKVLSLLILVHFLTLGSKSMQSRSRSWHFELYLN